MAYKNKSISNSITGQDILFLQTASDTKGELLEMETTYNSFSPEPVSHYHPNQSEEFTIISGELTVRIDGEIQLFKEGERLFIPPGKIHAMWNGTVQKTVVNWKVMPAMETEYLLETSTGLANDGKTNPKGMPNILQVSLTMKKYSRVFILAKPPRILQYVVFTFLSPAAYLLGYRSSYKKYF